MAMEACLRRNMLEYKLKFFSQCPGGRGFRATGRDACHRLYQYRPDSGRKAGRSAKQHWLCVPIKELARIPKYDTIQKPCGRGSTLYPEDENACRAVRCIALSCCTKSFDAGRRRVDAHAQSAAQSHRRREFADIIAALYDGSPSVSTVTEVTYEDGRKAVNRGYA